MLRLYPGHALLSLALAQRGLRKASLSPSGALAAFLAGYLALANPLGAVFGGSLLGFYLAGSRATKVKAAVKATYEEPDHVPSPSSLSAKPAPAHGQRTATQVACNALVGVLCAVLWRLLYSGEFSATALGQSWEEERRWCVVGRYGEEDPRRWSRVLVMVAVVFWGACCGDTLGILSTSAPLLLTTLRPAPRGTNGAISAWGTFVSLLGGVLVGGIAVVMMLLLGQGKDCACGGEMGRTWAGEVLVVGAGGGLGGSMIDSLLGALFQPTYFSPSRKLVVHTPPSSRSSSGKKDDTILLPGTALLGSWLSNNGVNAVSTICVAVGAGWWALR
ncbi:hypothetical protein JCM8547_008185 [Rhodosporidiobolus lusitaniae]